MIDFGSRAKDWDSDPTKVERAKAVAEAICQQIPINSQMTAFEYGCGTGLLSFALQPYLGQITLADSSSGMLAVLEEKIAASRIGNMTPLRLDLSIDPLPVEKYHLIYMLMVLHHIPDTAALLKIFYTMLQTPGYLCIADLDKEDGSYHGPDVDVHPGFDRDELGRQFEQAGFASVRLTTCYELGKGGRIYSLFLAVAEKR